MRAAVWNATGRLDLTDPPDPKPGPGWARVAVAATGICGTDLHFFRGAFPSPPGVLPGHEVGGRIDLLGDGVELAPGTELAVGTAVAVEPLVSCGRCPHCLTGHYNRCPERRLLGLSGRGGLADYMVAPATALYALPDSVPPEAGALVEPLAVCVRGTRLARVELGHSVAVLGSGTIGLMSILTARAAGAARVYATARHPVQHERARALGADAVFASAEDAARELGSDTVDAVIETVGGSAPTLSEAVRLARPGGAVSMLGVFSGDTPLPALDFSTKELTLVGSNCYGRTGSHSDFEIALQLLADQLDTFRALVTHRFPLEEVNRAFETAADKSTGSIKVAILPH